MNDDMVKLIVALTLILVSSLFAVRSAAPQKAERPAPARQRRERRSPLQVSGAAPPAAALATESLPSPIVGGSFRPRIFTGEPVTAEPDHGAGRRAIRLAGGLTLMAAAGALGILALVRAMVEVVERLGG
jgi:hypothetical protein